MKKLVIVAVLALGACGKTAAPLSPLDVAARRTCMDVIESRAVSRESVTYLNDGASQAATKRPDGQLSVAVKFSAKNEIGMASTLLATCVVSADGKKLVDIAVKDSR
jgi:hypothetical protein